MSKIEYQIKGSDLQYVEVVLPPGAAVIGEQGAMMYMDNNLNVTTVLGDGSQSKFGAIGRFFRALKRVFTGESLFSARYTNDLPTPQRVAFAASTIGKILAIDLDELGGELVCQKGAYLAGSDGIKVEIALQKRLRVGFFGGEGFIMQRITGSGIVFINASGALTQATLAPNQIIRVDSGCLVALSPSVTYDIQYAGKVKTALFGGEGLFYTSLKGPGRVWLQSLPMKRLSSELFRGMMAGQSQGKGLWGKLYLVAIVIFIFIGIFADKTPT